MIGHWAGREVVGVRGLLALLDLGVEVLLIILLPFLLLEVALVPHPPEPGLLSQQLLLERVQGYLCPPVRSAAFIEILLENVLQLDWVALLPNAL